VLSKYCAADGAEYEEQHAPPMVLEKKWQEFFVKQDIQTIRQHSQVFTPFPSHSLSSIPFLICL